MIVFFNDKFVDEGEVHISILDGGFLMGHGVYEVLRTFGSRVKFLPEHIDRFFESAEAMGLHMPYDKSKMISIVEELVKKRYEEIGSHGRDLRIRLQLTSGIDNVRVGVIKDFTLLVTAAEFVSDVGESVKVVTLDIERVRPSIKTTSMITNILSKKYARENGAYESLMINRKGFVTEGTCTNFFIVKNGILKTPKDDILLGITRAEILKLAKSLMNTEEIDIPQNDIYDADEIFLTNSTMGVIPVTHVDGRIIGNGEIGAYTIEIQKSYNASTG